jgi:hypothetical protein
VELDVSGLIMLAQTINVVIYQFQQTAILQMDVVGLQQLDVNHVRYRVPHRHAAVTLVAFGATILVLKIFAVRLLQQLHVLRHKLVVGTNYVKVVGYSSLRPLACHFRDVIGLIINVLIIIVLHGQTKGIAHLIKDVFGQQLVS